jgi:hypothetical protein
MDGIGLLFQKIPEMGHKTYIHTYIHTLFSDALAPTTTKVDFHGGHRYKKYYKEYKKEGN